jgi:hypothetical protein
LSGDFFTVPDGRGAVPEEVETNIGGVIMRTLLSAALLFAIPVLAAGQAPAPTATAEKPKDEKCSLEGRVLHAVSGEPVKRALLTLSRVGTVLGGVKTESDDDGRVTFSGLEPGSHTLVCAKAGFAKQSYGAKSNPDTGAQLQLPAGKALKDLVFKLAPGVATTRHISHKPT